VAKEFRNPLGKVRSATIEALKLVSSQDDFYSFMRAQQDSRKVPGKCNYDIIRGIVSME
jgi:hypothetical protein